MVVGGDGGGMRREDGVRYLCSELCCCLQCLLYIAKRV